MSSSAADWSSLPADLLQTIAGDLKTIPDYIRFRSVCRFWRASAELRPGFVPQEFPRLALPLNKSTGQGCFFNPLTDRHYGRHLPETSASHRCIGSSLGRLILIDRSSHDMVVLNPITGEKTSLPPLSSLPLLVMNNKYSHGYRYSLKEMRDKLLRKVILTPPNSLDPNNFSAFAISYRTSDFSVFPTSYRGFNHLAYCKHGDPSWRPIDDDDGTLFEYEDAIYFRGKLYLVTSLRSLATCVFNEHGTPTMYSITGDEQIGVVGFHWKHLLDVGGELVLVERYLEWEINRGYHTVKFCVLKFDWNAQEWKKPVTSIGDCVLFVGYNSSFAVTAAREYSGCKGNRIYFAGNYYMCDFDVGVYNLADGTIERIHLYDRKTQMIYGSPVWFTPSLW